MKPETCAVCGAEVRFGWRYGRVAWWHQVDEVVGTLLEQKLDHEVILGHPASAVDWAAVEAERETWVERNKESRAAEKAERAARKAEATDEELEAELDGVFGEAKKHKKGSEKVVRIFEIPPPEVYSTEVEKLDDRVPKGARDIWNHVLKHQWSAKATYSRAARVHASHGNLLDISDYLQLHLALDGSDKRAVGSWENGKFKFGYSWTIREDRKIVPERINSKGLRAWIGE